MKFPPTKAEARISEIFSSLQGEGTRLGERHLFVRFEECHIHCTYCDELDKGGVKMSQEDVLNAVARIDADEGPHQFISFTGGEPLLYVEFLRPLIQELSQKKHRIYLETNGILTPALKEIIHCVDVVAMDMKPSSVTGEKNYDGEHRSFLEIAKQKETFVKIIISKQLVLDEFLSLIGIVKEVAPRTPVILVPLSSKIEGHDDQELMVLLNKLQRLGGREIQDIRIVPRFHKILKIR